MDISSGLVRLAMNCVQKEFPNKLSHVMNHLGEVQRPRFLHPAFYGCFDWHSSVHAHWMMVRILRTFPNIPEAKEIRRLLNENISSRNIRNEVKYLDQPNRKSFERTYGWAWLLKLSQELMEWNDPDGIQWTENLRPLTRAIVERYIEFLPRQTYAIRTGVHPNTAFGISFAFDYARSAGDQQLEDVLIDAALRYFFHDEEYPAQWEPGGEDFFSAALLEADLMRKILEPDSFSQWFNRFLPDIGKMTHLINPATVSDRTDPKIVHLDGLNLSRAWCFLGIASSMKKDVHEQSIIVHAAIEHAKDALSNVGSGHYEGDHWLASFAVYMLSTAQETREAIYR
ncbi:MAG TPA: DUF2891 domain-containing protein [bacterium]|nr:DUF2891 domain-containing protein [bacterium]